MALRSKFSIFCQISIAAVAVALPIGCAESKVRDSNPDPVADKTLSDQARKMRSGGDEQHHSVGVSDEARDIEKDFGIK